MKISVGSLNPYCSGRWSRTQPYRLHLKVKLQVLILIVVDDGLVLTEVIVADNGFMS